LSHSKIQEITREAFLDVQFNSQDVFGYMLLPEESWFRYMKFSKSGKSGTKRSSTNLQTRDNLKHNRTCVTLQETINEIKLIGKEREICQIDHTISTHGDTNALSISTMTKTKKQVI